MQTMYPAANVVFRQLAADISSVTDTIPVDNVTGFPPAPNYAILERSDEQEVVLYTGLNTSLSQLTGCSQGLSGTLGQSWPEGTVIYHGLVSDLMNAMMGNIGGLDSDLGMLSGTVSGLGATVGGHTTALGALDGRVGDAEGAISDLETGKVPVTRQVNGKALGSDIMLGGPDILLPNYLKPSASGPIAVNDTVNSGLGKLEVALDERAANIASANGGSAAALTATVPNLGDILVNFTRVSIVPSVANSAGATLKVNNGSAYPIYKTDGTAIAAGDFPAGSVPQELMYYGGKYFFKAGGGTVVMPPTPLEPKYATGYTPSQSAAASITVTGLAFKPLAVFAYVTQTAMTANHFKAAMIIKNTDGTTYAQFSLGIGTAGNTLLISYGAETTMTTTATSFTINLGSQTFKFNGQIQWKAIGL